MTYCFCGNVINFQKTVDLQIEFKKKIQLCTIYDDHETASKLCEICLESIISDITTELQLRDSKFLILDPECSEYKKVESRFKESLRNKILRIEKHVNDTLLAKYDEFKQKSHIYDEKLLFHGSSHQNYYSILNNGFDLKKSKNGLQGYGIYFATDSSYSSSYTNSMRLVEDQSVVGNMLCCQVLITSDTGKADRNYCVRNSNQCYPSYIIYYLM
jgi:hypothetical protein